MAIPNGVRLLGLDPADLDNLTVEFEDKVKIIGEVKGKADFFNGKVTGMSKVRTYSECQGPSYSYGSKRYNCTIDFYDLKISYDGKINYGKMPKVNIKAKANVTSMLVFLEIAQYPNMSPTINSVVLKKIGQVNPKFTGLGPLNRFIKSLEDGFKHRALEILFDDMTGDLQTALGRAVSSLPFPM